MTDATPEQVTDPNQPTGAKGVDPLSRTRTSLRPAWLIKLSLVIVVFLGLGAWGLLDALVLYPNRGNLHTKFVLRQYLKAVDESPRVSWSDASVASPAEELARLDDAPASERSVVEETRRVWLESISRLHSLRAIGEANAAGEPPTELERATVFENPRATLQTLDQEWRGVQSVPKPLAAFDMPVQWTFVVVGFGGGLIILVIFLRNASRVYRFEPETCTITGPGELRITPETLVGFDMRKWDKFIVFVRLEGEQDERKLDLYRYVPLEEWALEAKRRSPHIEDEPDHDDSSNDQDMESDEPEADEDVNPSAPA
jgi:hypothetical protein